MLAALGFLLAGSGVSQPVTGQRDPAPDSILQASVTAGGYAAFLCSSVFVAKRDPEAVLRDELSTNLVDLPADAAERLRPVKTGVDRETRSAYAIPRFADDPFFRSEPRRAVFREELGCILMPPGSRAADAERLPKLAGWKPPADAGSRPWPDGDVLPKAPLPPEIDSAKLAAAVEAAFTGEKYRPRRTLAVIVVHRGRIIAERHAPGWGMHRQYRTWSTGKSIANALVGILVGEGKLDVKAPALIPEWKHPLDPRRNITLEKLLHMSSGLSSTGATPLGYWGGIDIASDAAAAVLERAPGTRWKYSNYDTILLLRAARAVIGDDTAYLAFPRRALLDRIGMFHTFPETDPFGNFVISSQIFTTARDLARFGLLYLTDGAWNGQRILPEG